MHPVKECNYYVQSLLDHLSPVPASCDYLIASGSRALIGKGARGSWPFDLSVFVGRSPTGARFRATQEATGIFFIEAAGKLDGLQPLDLSLFVRACIRRSSESHCTLYWPRELSLDIVDPLKSRMTRDGDHSRLEAAYGDLRAASQALVSEVYRYPLDIPWLYDPLDYEVMIPILKAPNVRRVLDLGCGSGRNAVPLENAGYEVHGIDSAPESIAICRRFVRAPERFREASASFLPYPAEYFDALLDVGCLHMIPDRVSRKAVLAEVWRVLKPGGFLCGRALTPRGPDWLAAQPFRSDATGFTPDEIMEESQGLFYPLILGFTQRLTYYRLLKIV